MLKLQNSANLKFYYLIPGFSTDFKKRKDLFNDGIKYFFDLNEEEGYEIAIEKISLSKFLLIEKSQFADDLQGNFVYNKDPFYLSVCFDYIPCQIVEERSEYYRNLCDKIAERFFTALLLVHPELELFNPVDYIVYQQEKDDESYIIQRDLRIYGRAAYCIDANQYVSLHDIDTDIFFIYKVLEMLYDKIPACLLGALSIFIDTYRVSADTTKAMYLLSAIELMFDKRMYNISNIKMISANGSLTISNFSSIRNDIAHGRGVSVNILSGLRELCQILLFDSLACVGVDEEFCQLSEKDARKMFSEQVIKHTNRNVVLLDRLRTCLEKLNIVSKFQNKIQ